jgi:thiol-disulfide isomerase/thioredoxin
VLLWVVGFACATTSHSENPAGDRLVLSIQNLICGDCGGMIESAAKAEPGVRDAKFDDEKTELHLIVAPGTPAEPIARALEGKEIDGRPIHVVVGAGQGAYAPFEALDTTADAREISSHGEDVPDLAKAASPGKVTVFDFSAVWCGPCHEVDAHMRTVIARDPGVAYRRINVDNWTSPVAKRYLAKVEALPFVIVLDGRGGEIARISGLDLGKLDAAIARGRSP